MPAERALRQRGTLQTEASRCRPSADQSMHSMHSTHSLLQWAARAALQARPGRRAGSTLTVCTPRHRRHPQHTPPAARRGSPPAQPCRNSSGWLRGAGRGCARQGPVTHYQAAPGTQRAWHRFSRSATELLLGTLALALPASPAPRLPCGRPAHLPASPHQAAPPRAAAHP